MISANLAITKRDNDFTAGLLCLVVCRFSIVIDNKVAFTTSLFCALQLSVSRSSSRHESKRKRG